MVMIGGSSGIRDLAVVVLRAPEVMVKVLVWLRLLADGLPGRSASVEILTV